jgi:hypothetical protein
MRVDALFEKSNGQHQDAARSGSSGAVRRDLLKQPWLAEETICHDNRGRDHREEVANEAAAHRPDNGVAEAAKAGIVGRRGGESKWAPAIPAMISIRRLTAVQAICFAFLVLKADLRCESAMHGEFVWPGERLS